MGSSGRDGARRSVALAFNSVCIAQYNGVDSTGSSLTETSSTLLPSISLNLSMDSWIIAAFKDLAGGSTYSEKTGSIRTQIKGTCIGDNTFSPFSANKSSFGFSQLVYENAIELKPKTTIIPKLSRSDLFYPYNTLSVVPTGIKIPFICKKCKLNVEARVYEDVRESAIALGYPSPAVGGIPAGERFQYVLCMGCQIWYRKNDYRPVKNVHMVDLVSERAFTGIEPRDTGFAPMNIVNPTGSQ